MELDKTKSYFCDFIDKSKYNGKELMIQARILEDNKTIRVCIDDIRKNWCVYDNGYEQTNPKIKDISKTDFNNLFKLTGYSIKL